MNPIGKYSTVRFDVAPAKRRAGVTRGALTSAERIRCIQANKWMEERRKQRRELLMGARREVSESISAREKRLKEREAVNKAVTESVLEFPAAEMKIKRDKQGNLSIQRRHKGKFLPSVKVAAGYTLNEIIIIITFIMVIVLLAGAGWAALHFVMKFW